MQTGAFISHFSFPPPPASLPCLPVSQSHQSASSPCTAHRCVSPPCPPAALNSFSPPVLPSHPSPQLSSFPSWPASVLSTFPAAALLCQFSAHRDTISPVPGKSRTCHYGDNPAPPLQPWQGHRAGAMHTRSARRAVGGMSTVPAWGLVTSGLLSTRAWGVLMDGREKSSENRAARNRDNSGENACGRLRALSP